MTTQTAKNVTLFSGFYRPNKDAGWKLIGSDPEKIQQHIDLGFKVMINCVDADGNLVRTYPNRASAERGHGNYDGRIGSFSFLNATMYTVRYGKTSANMRKTLQVKGSDLLLKLRTLHAEGNKGLAIDADGLHIIKPYSLDPVKVVDKRAAVTDPDPILNNALRSEETVIASGNFRVESHIDQSWTWFNVYHNGQKLVGYDAVASYIPQWGKLFKDTFACGMKWSDKRAAFFAKTPISTDDIATFISLYVESVDAHKSESVIPSVATTKEALREAKIASTPVKFNGTPGDAVTVVPNRPEPDHKPVAPVAPVVEAPVIDKQAILSQMMTLMQALIA
jgi:hypothetical protein